MMFRRFREIFRSGCGRQRWRHGFSMCGARPLRLDAPLRRPIMRKERIGLSLSAIGIGTAVLPAIQTSSVSRYESDLLHIRSSASRAACSGSRIATSICGCLGGSYQADAASGTSESDDSSQTSRSIKHAATCNWSRPASRSSIRTRTVR